MINFLIRIVMGESREPGRVVQKAPPTFYLKLQIGFTWAWRHSADSDPIKERSEKKKRTWLCWCVIQSTGPSRHRQKGFCPAFISQFYIRFVGSGGQTSATTSTMAPEQQHSSIFLNLSVTLRSNICMSLLKLPHCGFNIWWYGKTVLQLQWFCKDCLLLFG